MKTTSLTVSATGTRRRIQVSNPFTWAKVHALALNLRNCLPEEWQDLLPVTCVKDLKITLSLLACIGALLLPYFVCLPILATLAYFSYSWHTPKSKEGGRK